MKKFLSLLLVVAMLFSFTACGGGVESPEKAANNALKAVKSLDVVGMKKYFGEINLENFDISDISLDGISILKKIMSKMSWEIVETVEEEGSATVTINLTTINIAPVLSELTGEILGEAVSSILGKKLDFSELTDEAIKILKDELNKKDIELVTNEIDLKLTLTEEGWKVSVDVWSIVKNFV